MSRLSEDIVSNVDIVDVVSRYVSLKRVGRNFVGSSPFRNEKTPSFTVSPDKQIFKCFSTGIGGNVIKFIMEVERVDYWDAVQVLAKDAGIDLKEYQKKYTPKGQGTWSSQEDTREKQGEEKEKYKLMMRIAQQYFREELEKSSLASSYLREKRNIPLAISDSWGLGYAPDSSYGLVKLLRAKGFEEGDIIQSGLAKKGQSGDIYSFYRNRITFPIYDHLGNIVGFGARAINPEDNPKYLNSSDSILYDKSKILYGIDKAKTHLTEFDRLVVVEGYMDAIGFARLGYPIAVATCGTALTPNHIKLLKRYTQNVYLLFDNDEPGMQASIRALKEAYKSDLYPKALSLPGEYKDIDERANDSPTHEEVETFFAAAEDGFVGVLGQQIQLVVSRTGKKDEREALDNPVERKRFLQVMFDILLFVQDWTVLSWYIEILAKRIGVSYDILFSQCKTYSKTQTVQMSYMQKEKERANTSIKEDENMLFYAFFYNTFIHENQVADPFLDEQMMLVVELAGIIGDDTLLKVVSGEVDTMHEKLMQAQMWREKHREGLQQQKKIADVKHHCQSYIQGALKQIIKLKTLSDEEKQDILKRAMRK